MSKEILCVKCNKVREVANTTYYRTVNNPIVDGFRTSDCKSCVMKARSYNAHNEYLLYCPECDEVRETSASNFRKTTTDVRVDGSKTRYCLKHSKFKGLPKNSKKHYLFCPKCNKNREVSASSFRKADADVNADGSKNKMCIKHCKEFIKEPRTCNKCGKTEMIYQNSKKIDLCKSCAKKEYNKKYREEGKRKMYRRECDTCGEVSFLHNKQHSPTCVKCKNKSRTTGNTKIKEKTYFPLKCERCGIISHFKDEERAKQKYCGKCRSIIGKRMKVCTTKTKYEQTSSKVDAKPKRKDKAKESPLDEYDKEILAKEKARANPLKGLEQRDFNENERKYIEEFMRKRNMKCKN